MHTYIHTHTHIYCLFSQKKKKTQYGIEINGHVHIMKVKKVLFWVKIYRTWSFLFHVHLTVAFTIASWCHGVFSCYFFLEGNENSSLGKPGNLIRCLLLVQKILLSGGENKGFFFLSFSESYQKKKKKKVNQIMPLDFQIKASEDKNGWSRLGPKLMLSWCLQEKL